MNKRRLLIRRGIQEWNQPLGILTEEAAGHLAAYVDNLLAPDQTADQTNQIKITIELGNGETISVRTPPPA